MSGAVGTSSYDGPEGFTAHDVSDPRKPRKVWEFNAPPGIHMHKLRLVGDNFLYVNAERIGGWKGELRTGIFIFDISRPAEPRQVGFYDMPINGPHRFGIDKRAPARAAAGAGRGLERESHLDDGHPRPAQARDHQHLGPALAEEGRSGGADDRHGGWSMFAGCTVRR